MRSTDRRCQLDLRERGAPVSTPGPEDPTGRNPHDRVLCTPHDLLMGRIRALGAALGDS